MNRTTLMVLFLMVLALVPASGCAARSGSDSGASSRGLETSGGLVTPSLTRDDDGSATAVGTLVYRRDQGGFFALADLVPGEKPTTDAGIMAILVQSDGGRTGGDLGPLVGAYCAFSGTLREQAATSTPAPELIVESYRILKMP